MREELIKKATQQLSEDINAPLPIVTLEDFFEGNDDIGAIGCNLFEHPGIQTFYEILKDIRAKDSVQDVFIEIYELPEDDDLWPFSERVYILSNSSIDEITEWIKELEPSAVDEGWMFGIPEVAPKLKDGYNVYSIWWD